MIYEKLKIIIKCITLTKDVLILAMNIGIEVSLYPDLIAGKSISLMQSVYAI